MNKVIERIEIPSKLCDYIQMLYYEYQGYQTNIQAIMSNINYEEIKYKNRHFRKYCKKYDKSFKAYNLAMDELKRMYATKYMYDNAYSIRVLFNDNILEVSQNCGGTCNVDIKTI